MQDPIYSGKKIAQGSWNDSETSVHRYEHFDQNQRMQLLELAGDKSLAVPS